jgi:hypothetical protein
VTCSSAAVMQGRQLGAPPDYKTAALPIELRRRPLKGKETLLPGGQGPLLTLGVPTQIRYRGEGSFNRRSSSALTATSRLEPDIDRAAISGRSTSPNAGSKTPAAIGIAIAL